MVISFGRKDQPSPNKSSWRFQHIQRIVVELDLSPRDFNHLGNSKSLFYFVVLNSWGHMFSKPSCKTLFGIPSLKPTASLPLKIKEVGKSGFATITWEMSLKKCEKPGTWPRDKRYQSIFRSPIFPCNKVQGMRVSNSFFSPENTTNRERQQMEVWMIIFLHTNININIYIYLHNIYII